MKTINKDTVESGNREELLNNPEVIKIAVEYACKIRKNIMSSPDGPSSLFTEKGFKGLMSPTLFTTNDGVDIKDLNTVVYIIYGNDTRYYTAEKYLKDIKNLSKELKVFYKWENLVNHCAKCTTKGFSYQDISNCLSELYQKNLITSSVRFTILTELEKKL